MADSTSQQFLRDLDKKLWSAADRLRANLDAAVYKHAVLGLIFLKYVSDLFAVRQANPDNSPTIMSGFKWPWTVILESRQYPDKKVGIRPSQEVLPISAESAGSKSPPSF